MVSNPSTIPGDCGDGFCPSTTWQSDLRTQEEQLAVFAQLELNLMWGEMPVNLDVGLRYEETEVASQALVPVRTQVDWITANEFTAVTATDANGNPVQDFSALDGEYDHVLPNVDFNIEPFEDFLLRASYSQTIGRPNYNDIQGGLTLGECRAFGCFSFSGRSRAAGRSNPRTSTSRSSGITARAATPPQAISRKDTENFIGQRFLSGTADQLFPGAGLGDLTNPSVGGLAATARANGAVTDDEVRAYIFANFPDDPSVDVANQIITGNANNDPVTYEWQVPANTDEAVIDGWEIAWQHTFGDTGFGFIANATFVDGDISYDNLSTDEQFALFGLSDSANFIGFFDKYDVEVRLAYNWRDDFLTGIGHDSFGGAQPRYVEAYGQWDLNASYTFGYDIEYQVFLEAINITDETTREHGRSPFDLLNATQVGARYALGFRAKF